jgi:hypothetical protein
MVNNYLWLNHLVRIQQTNLILDKHMFIDMISINEISFKFQHMRVLFMPLNGHQIGSI